MTNAKLQKLFRVMKSTEVPVDLIRHSRPGMKPSAQTRAA